MREAYGLDPFLENPRMEEVFNYLYSDAHSGSPSPDCLSAYWSLIRMYRAAIGRTTNNLEGTSRAGVGALLRYLWKQDPSRTITFLTFNQDLVIEKALNNAVQTRSYELIPWNLAFSYAMPFASIISSTNQSTPFVSSSTHSIEVLKLHGSLNWVYTARSGTDPRNSIRNPQGKLRCINDQEVGLGRLTLTASKPNKRGRRVDLIPLVVPPIYEKASRYQAVLRPVWDRARDALGRADELIVFGYSFPDTDFAARTMLRHTYFKNDGLRDVHVIDIDPAVASKVANVLAAKSVYFYRSVQTFTEYYD